MRNFGSGATRDSADWKLDLKGFLSARAIHMLGRYMHFHRKQADGKLRDSDNWKLGIPIKVYEESGTRHFFEWLKALEADKEANWSTAHVDGLAVVAALGLMFNLQGWLHEQSKLAEKLGIPVDDLIDTYAQAVKDRDTDAAKKASGALDYEALRRSIQRTTDDEFRRKNPGKANVYINTDPSVSSVTFDPAEDYHGPALATPYKSGSAYHGITPNPNPAPPGFGQHSDWTGAEHGHGPAPADHHDPYVDASLLRPFDTEDRRGS